MESYFSFTNTVKCSQLPSYARGCSLRRSWYLCSLREYYLQLCVEPGAWNPIVSSGGSPVLSPIKFCSSLPPSMVFGTLAFLGAISTVSFGLAATIRCCARNLGLCKCSGLQPSKFYSSRLVHPHAERLVLGPAALIKFLCLSL